jgi:mannose-6-phosphate isomerase-like protein (cupin superfamily)
MARLGQSIENPVTGEAAHWPLTGGETGGRLSRCAMRVRPGGFVAVEHVHPRSEERFEVLDGRMHVCVDGRCSILGPGQRATVPVGARHRWRNAGSSELCFVVEMEPAYGFEQVLETAFGLARDGKVDRHGLPGPLQLAVFCRHFADSIYVTRPPRWLQGLLFALLDPIGRARRLRAVYSAYSDTGA